MESPRVAVVAYSAPPLSAGGVASAHYNLFRKLQQQGVEARLFTFGDPATDDGDIVRRGTPNWLSSLTKKILGALFSLLQPGKQAYQMIDIAKSYVGARRAGRAIEQFQPDVIILSDHGAPGLGIRKTNKAKLILVSHHNPARFVSIEGANYSELDARMAVWLEQRVVNKADAVVCPSHYMRDWFERTYRFESSVEVIPNLLDEEYIESIPPFDLHSQFNLDADVPVIYMPSAGSPLKGAKYVLEIIEELVKQAKQTIGFYIPGDIPGEWVERLAAFPEQARLCLTGQLTYEENIANVKDCSFGISPSLIENYSMALLEAVYCGVPMLAFDTGGNADIIQDGRNGFLAAEGDSRALVEKALPLLEKETLETWQKQTLTLSREQLSSQRAADAYMDLIVRLWRE